MPSIFHNILNTPTKSDQYFHTDNKVKVPVKLADAISPRYYSCIPKVHLSELVDWQLYYQESGTTYIAHRLSEDIWGISSSADNMSKPWV